MASTALTYDQKLALYEALIATHPKIERKGKSNPYTSVNGHMFSYLSKEGELGLRLVERLDVISEGNIKIQFFEPGALVPALEIFDAVSSGAIDAGFTTAGYWAGKVPALQFFTAVPFGPDAMEYAAWLYYAGGDVLYDQIYEPFNIKALHCGVHSPEGSGWFREPIESIDDLKGLKMRFFALGARVMEKLGVSTQLLAGGDIFPALELGTIDATEYASPAIDKGLGFYQIAKHYYFPGWHQQSTWVDVIFNLDKWNALSPRQQVLLTTACGDSVRESIAMGEARQVPAIAFLKEKGVQFHLWPQEILDAYSAAWDVVVAEELAAQRHVEAGRRMTRQCTCRVVGGALDQDWQWWFGRILWRQDQSIELHAITHRHHLFADLKIVVLESFAQRLLCKRRRA